MNNLNYYNSIPRNGFGVLSSPKKNNIINKLECLVIEDSDTAKRIIKTLIEFKYYRKNGDSNKQEEALNFLGNLVTRVKNIQITKEELMALVKNRSYFIHQSIPKTFVNFLNKLKENNSKIFQSVTKTYTQFLKSSGVKVNLNKEFKKNNRDILNRAFIAEQPSDLYEDNASLNNILDKLNAEIVQENIEKKLSTIRPEYINLEINKILSKMIKQRIPINGEITEETDTFICSKYKVKNINELLVIEFDPIGFDSVKNLSDSIQTGTLNVCAIKRANKWVIQDNNSMNEWFKTQEKYIKKDPLTKQKIITCGEACNFIFGKSLLKLLYTITYYD